MIVDGQLFTFGMMHRIGAEARLSQAFAGYRTFHELSGHLGVNRHGGYNAITYTQTVGGLRWTAILSDGSAASIGLDLGSRIREAHAMRKRLSVIFIARVANLPVQVDFSLRYNRGGLFLGEERRSTVTNLTLGIEPRKNLLVSAGMSRTYARHGFLDNRSINLSVLWRF